MKLFLRSIVFFGITSFTPLAFAQIDAWTNQITDNTFDTGSNWTTALATGTVPGAANTAFIYPGFTAVADPAIPTIFLAPNGSLNITIGTPNNQSVQGLIISSDFVQNSFNGTVNLNFTGGSALTVGTSGAEILGGATLNYAGNFQMLSGLLVIGSDVSSLDPGQVTGSGVLNISSGTFNLDSANTSLIVGVDTAATSGTVVQGNALANTSSTVTTGQFLTVGANEINGSTGGVGTYSLTASSILNIGTPGTPQSATYTVEIGADAGTIGTLNITGNSTLSAVNPNTLIELGGSTGATGTLNQTGGTFTAGSSTTFLVGNNGAGTYNLSAGSADFANGFTVGNQSGSQGVVNQTGGTLTAENIVILGSSGTGTYNLSNGTATFNSGGFVGAASTITQTGGTMIITTGQALDLNFAGSVYNLNGGTLNVDGDGIFTGLITAGGGTLNFGGGTLQPLGGDLVDPLDGTVTGTSTLDTTAHNITINGNLSGTGGFTLIGNQTVTLNGANTFTGQINVNGGTLQAGVGNLNNNSIAIGSSGTFDLTPVNAIDTFGGAISGSGNFITGANTVVLTQTVNFTGTTSIGATGTLEAANGSFGDINGAGSNFIVGGTIPGTVNFTGNNSFTGSTTINPGFTLMANNLSGSVANAGTIGSNLSLPGSQSSTFTIGSDFNSTNTFVVRTNGSVTDLYTVGGVSNLSGTVTLIGAGNITNHVIVSSTGAMDTSGLTLSVGGSHLLFNATIQQVGNDLELTTVQTPLASFAVTPNQMAVAGAIDSILLAPPPSFNPVGVALNNLSAAQLPVALDQLSPESLQYARNIAFQNSTFLVQHINGHLADLRSGYSGLDTNGLGFVMPGFESGLGRTLESLLAYNAPAPNGVNYYPSDDDSISDSGANSGTISDSPSPMGRASRSSSKPSVNGARFSEFISGDLVLADMNRNQSAAYAPPSKASYTAVDGTAGISFRMTNNLAAGVLLDYNHTEAKTDSNGSRTKVDTVSPGLFGTFFQGGFYANGLLSYGYNSYSNTRSIAFLGSTATSSPSGNQYVGNLDVGYDFHPDHNWALGPTLGATYTHLDISSFDETGAGAADLSVKSQSADSFRSRLGAHVVYQAQAHSILFQPNFTLAWQHEYLDSSSGITSQFSVPGSTPFTIQTAAPARDSALIGFGSTAILNNSMTLYLNYLANVGVQDYFAQSVEGGFKARF